MQRSRNITAADRAGCIVTMLFALFLATMGFAQSIAGTRPATTTSPAAVEPAPNPHWSSAGCRQCHSEPSGRFERIPAETVDAVCLKCHDGVRARAERHPIGRKFDNKQIVLPGGWPAPKNKIGCLTCHDVLMGCDHKAVRSTDNSQFLRGYEGGDLLSYCGRCHVSSESQGRFDPHVMLAPNGEVLEKTCRFCHQKSFDIHQRAQRTGQAALRLDEISLCLSCHTRHVDYFEPGHIGALISPKMKAQRQTVVTTQPVSAHLPLAEGGRVVCSTCHNPHQQGVFPADSPLALGAMPPSRSKTKLALRGLDQNLCRACHGK